MTLQILSILPIEVDRTILLGLGKHNSPDVKTATKQIRLRRVRSANNEVNIVRNRTVLI